MKFEEIEDSILRYQSRGLRIFTTSSFQTHSLALLHMLSRIDRNIPVWMINTGYLFPETLSFARKVVQQFGLTLHETFSATPRYLQKNRDGRLMFTQDPDFCCYLNKTRPVESLLQTHDVWINGIRADQSKVREAMETEEPAPFDTLRLHPMLDWSAREIHQYIRSHDIPRHPLDDQGYVSIGCEPCTRKPSPDMLEREARWYGLAKTECGLHSDLIASAK